MSNKLIDLNALSAYKTSSDAKYQDKLTAGAGIAMSNNVISASGEPTVTSPSLSNQTINNNTLTKFGEYTFQPGCYFIQYACRFASDSNGYRQIGFSSSSTDITGFGWAFMDSQPAISGTLTQTMIDGVFEVSEQDYPNGRTFYFLAQQNSGSNLSCYPRANFMKF